ncbi:hypothetical protein BB558_001796 [Smittium angustum]|uniref:Integrase zinc-binding domain-containing protein n=1 Tax=Smittium angustum TaxID=133377 RepID=A0A2U1JAE2_SMIAN|nr:hypothetical protein BB558_001796 [Smittium angustum]
MGMRMRTSSATGFSPHFLMFGTNSRIPNDPISENPLSKAIRELELDRINIFREKLRSEAKSSNTVPQFKTNSLVMVLDSNLRKGAIKPKIMPRYVGPFKVISKGEHNVYILEDEEGQRHTIHASRIINFHSRGFIQSGECQVENSNRKAIMKHSANIEGQDKGTEMTQPFKW